MRITQLVKFHSKCIQCLKAWSKAIIGVDQMEFLLLRGWSNSLHLNVGNFHTFMPTIAIEGKINSLIYIHQLSFQGKWVTVRAPVFDRHQFFGTSEHYGKAHGSLLSGWINYNYTACCWFPTSSNILILPSQFWQIMFESCWLHCSKCWIQMYWCFYGTFLYEGKNPQLICRNYNHPTSTTQVKSLFTSTVMSGCQKHVKIDGDKSMMDSTNR